MSALWQVKKGKDMNINWPKEVIEAACNAADGPFSDRPTEARMRHILNAAMAKMVECGMAEACEHFTWSDGGPHTFGTSEDDMPPVIILRTDGE